MTYRLLLALLIGVLAASATAQDQPKLPSVYSMVVGQETWELVDNRQLTFSADGRVTDFAISPDGKQVAYICETPDHISLCLVSSGGGRPVAVIKTPMPGTVEAANIKEVWQVDNPVVWSLDGKTLAFPAVRITGVDEDEQHHWHVILLNSKGAQRAVIPVDDRVSRITFTSSSHEMTVISSSYTADPPTQVPELKKTVYDIHSSPTCVVSSEPVVNSEVESYIYYSADRLSPNGSLRIQSIESGLAIENVQTGLSTLVVPLKFSSFNCWLPNSRFFTYTSCITIPNGPDDRKDTLHTLWLADATSTKFNTMCIALDFDEMRQLSWSSDCTRAAYTSQERLYVAEIIKRPSSPYEKAAAGLPLNEEEMKTVLHRCAVMIDIALEQYMMDQKGNHPTSMEDLVQFVQPDVFYKPGTGELIFEFGGESADGAPLVGTYDAGYNWKIEIGQHGGIHEVEKQ